MGQGLGRTETWFEKESHVCRHSHFILLRDIWKISRHSSTLFLMLMAFLEITSVSALLSRLEYRWLKRDYRGEEMKINNKFWVKEHRQSKLERSEMKIKSKIYRQINRIFSKILIIKNISLTAKKYPNDSSCCVFALCTDEKLACCNRDRRKKNRI